jgi:hypothetical protein
LITKDRRKDIYKDFVLTKEDRKILEKYFKNNNVD